MNGVKGFEDTTVLASGDGGGEDGDTRLGLVSHSATEERQQVLGTCSPERLAVLESLLMDRLWRVRDTCITGPEQRAVDDCLKAAREVFGRES